MTAATVSRRRHILDLVEQVVGEYVTELQKGYLADKSTAVARLAQLRRGAGKLPQDIPELWGVSGLERLYQDGHLSEAEASRAEAAAFLAITLYALHQQSRPQTGMHRRGVELGAAVRRLMPGGDIDEPIRRRFVQVGMASTREVLADRLRGIVSLLRGESIPLDYAMLARQLYQAQSADSLREVRLSWGRSLHAYRSETPKADTDSNGVAQDDKDVK